MKTSIVILAAGQGSRMGGAGPKVLQPLAGRPMLAHVLDVARQLNPEHIVVVCGYEHDKLKQVFAGQNDILWALQEKQLGTGHAVAQALPLIPDNEQVLVLFGDVPLVSKAPLEELQQLSDSTSLALLACHAENPTGYGRIVRQSNQQVERIVEEVDATLQERAIQEVFTGILCAPANLLKQALPALKPNNKQQEIYLTDVVGWANAQGHAIHCLVSEDERCLQGVNTLEQLHRAERTWQRAKALELMQQGVRIADLERLDIRGKCKIKAGSFLDANVMLEGEVQVGENTHIGPYVQLKNVRLGSHVIIRGHCVLEDVTVEDHAVIGPFAYLRPGTQLAQETKVGSFVELKKTTVGRGSKVPHLSYLGDTDIGESVNIGAGVITCNYDGQNKHKTTIEDGAFVGAGTQLVAPMRVGQEAVVGAGSCLAQDVQAKSLSLSRAPQKHIADWKKRTKNIEED